MACIVPDPRPRIWTAAWPLRKVILPLLGSHRGRNEATLEPASSLLPTLAVQVNRPLLPPVRSARQTRYNLPSLVVQITSSLLGEKRTLCLRRGAPATRPAASHLADAIHILLCSIKVTLPVLDERDTLAVLSCPTRWTRLPLPPLAITETRIPRGTVFLPIAQTLLLHLQYNALPEVVSRKCIGRPARPATRPDAPLLTLCPKTPNEFPLLSKQQNDPLLEV